MSAFALEDGVVYHAYSAYARGLDGLWGVYQWLDRAPKGRHEEGVWWRRHDDYARGWLLLSSQSNSVKGAWLPRARTSLVLTRTVNARALAHGLCPATLPH